MYIWSMWRHSFAFLIQVSSFESLYLYPNRHKMRDILSVCTVTLIGVYLHCPMKDRKNRILRIVMSDDDDIYDICKNYDMYIYIYIYVYICTYIIFFHIPITFLHVHIIFFRILLVLCCIILYMVVCFVCFCLIVYTMYSYCYICSVLCILFHCAVLCTVCV